MTASPRFIHLRTHTEYSLLEGAVRLKKLPDLCKAHKMPAIAITDTNSMFAALEFSVTLSEAGVQPILGCQVDLTFEASDPGEKVKLPAPLVLLAQNETGYEHLMKLSSCLYVDGDGQVPQVSIEALEANSGGLICLTGGPDGPVGRLLRQGQRPAAEALMRRLAAMFPDRLYVELQRHPTEDGQPEAETLTERGHIEMAYAMELPLVATNDVYFPKTEMYEAHDALICIAEGAYVDQAEPRRRLTPQHYFKSQEEMIALFADLPEAIENTVEIARRCAFMAYRRDPILPKFADDEVAELRRIANEGLQKRLAVIPHAVSVEKYQERLDFELNIIEGMGFPGYFLIVADFIQWAKDHDIPVGPGRGSGAGSLVAYALTITDLDPLRYSLLFERFLNPERVSMPDFDIDFCMDRREEVIRYVQQKYGRDKVGQIITFGALLSKAAVRDIGRVLQMPFGQVDRLSKMIPVEGVKPVSIEKALQDEPRLAEEARSEPVVNRLLTYGQQVEGLLRNASTHAAGVVIGDRPLDALVPLYQDPRSDMPATQFNMKWVEQAGLVKFDFLGLKTLTVIQNAMELIFKSGRPLHVSADGRQLYDPAEGAANQINAIPLDDATTYELYSRAKTVAVFQVESTGMMDALKRMKPTCIEDIVALVALYRPGPMENIPVYCEVKNGLRKIQSVHPLIDHILEETQGIIVYQEQVMQIAQVMAGYSLGGADLLRRAMGKKIKEAMDAERPKFEKGAGENGVAAKKASEVFDLLEKFANYGFNKSHAAAYAVVSYQTAWLKANHPVEFMAGVMNCDIHLTDKLSVYFEEVKKGLALPYVAPDINRSLATFDVVEGHLVYALGALKNVGVEAMNLIVAAREDRPFVNLYDFARRVDLKKVGKRPLEMLARAGAFDVLDRNRRRVFESLEGLVAYSGAIQDQKNSNQVSLFGEAGDDLPEPRLAGVPDWLPAERLNEEFKAVGFYLTGHPLDDYMPALKRKDVMTLDEVMTKAERGPFMAKMAGVVAGRQERKSARGNRFAFAQLSDTTGAYEVTIFSDVLEKSRDYLETGSKVVITAEATMESDQLKLLMRSAGPVDSAIADAGRSSLRVYLDSASAVATVATVLEDAKKVARNASPGEIYVYLQDPALPGDVEMDLGQMFPINPQIKGALKSLDGVMDVEEI
ncbi:DNA polymerase III subunit alpha [Tritonibacter horizontis]|uniref:DNA polymerase III subunit alpha n=1 Tax=Tritonibacter horizontis TaxID=1768241 RepID=A0A132C345_9RHOB|nr:DNA polymerase III subunit alpha [Tritonibacter horizontis]KUP95085.1 DNA polymerase III subunit alpha [Tritonibacter horizontis]